MQIFFPHQCSPLMFELKLVIAWHISSLLSHLDSIDKTWPTQPNLHNPTNTTWLTIPNVHIIHLTQPNFLLCSFWCKRNVWRLHWICKSSHEHKIPQTLCISVSVCQSVPLFCFSIPYEYLNFSNNLLEIFS